MQKNNKSATIISPESSAPQLDDEQKFPNVARYVTNGHTFQARLSSDLKSLLGFFFSTWREFWIQDVVWSHNRRACQNASRIQNKEVYATFATLYLQAGMVELMMRYGWKRIGVLADESKHGDHISYYYAVVSHTNSVKY